MAVFGHILEAACHSSPTQSVGKTRNCHGSGIYLHSSIIVHELNQIRIIFCIPEADCWMTQYRGLRPEKPFPFQYIHLKMTSENLLRVPTIVACLLQNTLSAIQIFIVLSTSL